jgi:LAGLIDADG endonuclease
VSGADNQQERLAVEAIPSSLGSFLSGFALGEGSFMLVCRRRGDYGRKWKLSAAFNVSQKDLAPLELFRDTLGCGSIRRAGNGGWYWEVNHLAEIRQRVIPFFDRFPLFGKKAVDYSLFRSAVELLAAGLKSEADYAAVLGLRDRTNGGGKRRYTAERILRDYTPTSPVSTER